MRQYAEFGSPVIELCRLKCGFSIKFSHIQFSFTSVMILSRTLFVSKVELLILYYCSIGTTLARWT
jgi:hypothetical protein